MRSSRKKVSSASHALPEVQFAEHDLTSFGGLVVFQAFLQGINLKRRLRHCVRHLETATAYSCSRMLLLLIVHVLLGWRRLRDLDYYREDPLVLRVLGLRRLPDVSTVSRRLGQFDSTSVDNLRGLLRGIVGARACAASPARITLDFDGSVLSTKARGIEGTAVGYNNKRKGCRSYYPLFAMLAQTGQVFDVLHRAGNIHDSNGASDFILECFARLKEHGFRGRAEARMDSAHFSDKTCTALDDNDIEFSVSVPFERLPELKSVVESRRTWREIDDDWAYFEWTWRPSKKSNKVFNCVVFRHRVSKPHQGPIQLDLFRPTEREYEFKVVLTNKAASASATLAFHNGRAAQEGTFAELKTDLPLDYLPSRRLVGNQVWILSTLLAQALTREMQMSATTPRHARNTPTREPLWLLERVDTLRKHIIQRAARITRPAHRIVITLARNAAVERDIRRLLQPWGRAA
jgi:hypothetical protein